MDQHEIGGARRHREAEFADLRRQPGEPLLVMGARHLHVLGVADRRDAGGDRRLTDVERTADAVERRDHMGGPVEPAEPQGRKAVDLREGPAHDDVVASGDQFDARLVVVAPHVFGIGRVDYEKHMGRQRTLQPLDFVERHVGAGRIVGIGEIDEPGLCGHALEDRVDVGGVIRLRRHHGRAARAKGGDVIDQKSVGGMDRLVAGTDERMGEQIEKLIRAGPAHDPRGIEPERAPDRLAQLGGRTVGIFVQPHRLGLVGFDRLRARSQRCFVRGQLEHLGDAGRRAPAGHIGIDRKHAGARFGAHQRGHHGLQGASDGIV
jgi:hypothetical protein